MKRKMIEEIKWSVFGIAAAAVLTAPIYILTCLIILIAG